MLTKLKYCLVHPKMMGSLIVEKTWKPVLLLIVLFLINAATMFAVNYKNTYVTNEEKYAFTQSILDDEDASFTYQDGKLSFNNDEYIVYGFRLYFGDNFTFDNKNVMSLVFGETEVTSYYANVKVKTVKYSDFTLNNFSINSKNTDFKTFLNFANLVEASFTALYPAVYTAQTINQVGQELFSILMLFLMVFLFTGALNRQVTGALRIRLLMYSFVSYFFIEWLYIIFDVFFLQLLAFIIPFVYFMIALKNIVRVKRGVNVEK